MNNIITIADGAGGEKMDHLIKKTFLKYFEKNGEKVDVPLSELDDSAVINGIVFSTDTHTVQPLFFPGGNIGSLAVAGTVNDVSVMGAKPLALSTGFVIEEGFSKSDFERIIATMAEMAEKADVPIVTGDTKVVEKGALQEMIINTSGIGVRTPLLDSNIEEVRRYREYKGEWLLDSNLEEGDKIIVSGRIGDHGVALLSFREGYGFESKIKSDVAPVNGLIEEVLKAGGVTTAKDPTRGGLSNTLNEISEKSGVGIIVYEEKIPVSNDVKAACEMLGIDPLEIGNEGKVVLGVVKEKAEEVLDSIKKHPLGKNAEIIGEARSDVKGVLMETIVGGRRVLHKPIGDPIPRIC
ncbi:MAG: hydrogenase expression/formation protein HypE [Thermoplasmata archaeon]|nr:hydrogenase expression/formation protein HypE [Thermoplasmata archaeon]